MMDRLVVATVVVANHNHQERKNKSYYFDFVIQEYPCTLQGLTFFCSHFFPSIVSQDGQEY